MNIAIADYQDYLNLKKETNLDRFCGQCGLELSQTDAFGLCPDCYAQAFDGVENDSRDDEHDESDWLQSQEDNFGGTEQW